MNHSTNALGINRPFSSKLRDYSVLPNRHQSLEYDRNPRWPQFLAGDRFGSFLQLFCRFVENKSDEAGHISLLISDVVSQSHPLLWWYMIEVSNIVVLPSGLLMSLALTFGQEVCWSTGYWTSHFNKNEFTGWSAMGENSPAQKNDMYYVGLKRSILFRGSAGPPWLFYISVYIAYPICSVGKLYWSQIL